MGADIREIVLGHQLDAATRTVSLFSDRKMTIHDVINILAQAEDDAQYVCGFIDLDQYDDEKNLILEKLVERGLGNVDDRGYITLTPEGLKRAQTKLPKPIEEKLKEY